MGKNNMYTICIFSLVKERFLIPPCQRASLLSPPDKEHPSYLPPDKGDTGGLKI